MAQMTFGSLRIADVLSLKATPRDYARAAQVAEIILAGRDPAACAAEFDRQWKASPVDENVPATMTGDARVWWEARQAANWAFMNGNPANYMGCHLYPAA